MGIPIEDFIADQLDPPPPRTRTLCTALECPCLDCPRRRAQLFSHSQHSRSVRPTPPPFREALIMMDAAIEARRRTTLRNNLAEIAVATTADLQHHPQPSSSSSDNNNRHLDTPHASITTSSSVTTVAGSSTSSRSNSSTQAGSSAAQQQTDSDTESPPYLFRHALRSLPPTTVPQSQNSPSPPRAMEASDRSAPVLSSASAPTSATSSSTPSIAASPTSTPIPATLQSSQWPSSSGGGGGDGGPYRNILWNRRNSTGSHLSRRSRGSGDVRGHTVQSGQYSATLEEAEETLPRLTPRPLSTTPAASLTGSAASSLPSPTESVAMDSDSTIAAHPNAAAAAGQVVNINNTVEHAIEEGADGSSNNASAVQEWAVRMELEGTDYYHDSDDDSAHGHHHARLQRMEQELQRQRQQEQQQPQQHQQRHDYL